MPIASVIRQRDVFAGSDLPLVIRRCPEHGSSTGWHAHDFSELVVIVDGRARHVVGDEVYDIQAGDVFVILGDTAHSYMDTAGLSLINILYDFNRLGIPLADIGSVPGYQALFELEPRLRRHRKFRNRLRLSIDKLAALARQIAELEEELSGRAPGYRFAATALFMGLITRLSRAYSKLDPETVRPVTQLSELLGYMQRHCAEALTLRDLARAAGMSQSSLLRSFRQIVGHSPIDYLIRLRVSRARQLLLHTDLSVSAIALEVGFCDGNYLSRRFRQVTGTSPRRFRQQLGAGPV